MVSSTIPARATRTTVVLSIFITWYQSKPSRAKASAKIRSSRVPWRKFSLKAFQKGFQTAGASPRAIFIPTVIAAAAAAPMGSTGMEKSMNSSPSFT